MSRVRSIWRILAVLLALAVVAAACGSDEGGADASDSSSAAGSTEPVTLRLGYFANITHAAALVGVGNGIFEEALADNVTLETSTFNAGPAEIEALLGDALDIGYIGPNPALNAYVQSDGEAVRIIAGATSGGAYLIVNPSISTAADLEGKTLATPQLGNTQDVALRSWLKEEGLSSDTSGGGDVSIVPQENSQTLDAFKAGDIDGAWVPEPWATRLIQEGGGKVLVDEKTLWPDGEYATTEIIVRTAFLEEHPDVVQQFLEGHLEATDFLSTNPTESKTVVNDQINAITGKKLSDQVINTAWDNLTFTVDPLAATVETSAEDAAAVGVSKPVEDIAGLFDVKILNDVLVAAGKEKVEAL